MPAQPAPAPVPSQASGRASAIEAAHVSHSIPARITVGLPRTVEVRIARPALAPIGQGQSQAPRGEAVAVRAISVRLRPLRNGCIVDAPSPETLWDKPAASGRLAGDAAVWRFVITPQRSGRTELSLQVSTCVVGMDGVLAEGTMPEQQIVVRALPNFARIARRGGITLGLVIGAIVMAEGIEMAFRVNVLSLLKKLVM
jgi:hypothetical protein